MGGPTRRTAGIIGSPVSDPFVRPPTDRPAESRGPGVLRVGH